MDHRLKSIIDGSDELQLQTECEIAGLAWATPRPPHRTALADLQTIQAYQKAWRTLTWTQRTSMRGLPTNIWVGDYMIHQHAGDPPELARSVLDIHRIASPMRGVSEKTWRIQNLGFNIHSFAVDPSQDLLVVLEEVDPA